MLQIWYHLEQLHYTWWRVHKEKKLVDDASSSQMTLQFHRVDSPWWLGNNHGCTMHIDENIISLSCSKQFYRVEYYSVNFANWRSPTVVDIIATTTRITLSVREPGLGIMNRIGETKFHSGVRSTDSNDRDAVHKDVKLQTMAPQSASSTAYISNGRSEHRKKPAVTAMTARSTNLWAARSDVKQSLPP